MRSLVVVYFLLIILVSVGGCKKCFTCYNSCVLCTRVVANIALLDTLCNDNYASQSEYEAAIAQDTTIGYVCVSTTPTYQYDFCVNNPGEEQYPNYFNKGNKAQCDEK